MEEEGRQIARNAMHSTTRQKKKNTEERDSSRCRCADFFFPYFYSLRFECLRWIYVFSCISMHYLWYNRPVCCGMIVSTPSSRFNFMIWKHCTDMYIMTLDAEPSVQEWLRNNLNVKNGLIWCCWFCIRSHEASSNNVCWSFYESLR